MTNATVTVTNVEKLSARDGSNFAEFLAETVAELGELVILSGKFSKKSKRGEVILSVVATADDFKAFQSVPVEGRGPLLGRLSHRRTVADAHLPEQHNSFLASTVEYFLSRS